MILMKVEVKNNMAYIKEDGDIVTYVTFPFIKENVADINRVFTSSKQRGKGLAKIVMDGLYDYLKENNLKVVPTCPYAVVYFKRYKDKQDVLKQGKL